ncbi:MAG: L-2-hydroxyglutarate oxidase [Euryarchaeota archaeon]|nr:L-2-hydroxyglutarate oxidase [Euryarchaeota archaeon]
MEPDVLVIGAGAIGTSTAYHLAKAGHRVQVVEKESGPALHQSGRNSGVIHAGYNLKPGSIKARYCVEGSRRLREYCKRRGVAVEQGGILVVAQDETEIATLKELARRAAANGVAARNVDGGDIPNLEPEARGVQALHAPEAASFDARSYVHALASDALAAGAEFLYDRKATAIDEGRAATSKGPISAKVVVNCAGLHADRLAKRLAPDVRIIPFRGYYAELVPARTGLVRSHIYAAPDLRFPFLGVHLSRRVDGRVIVGPGAMLAFGREAYGFFEANPRDLVATLGWPGFLRLSLTPPFRRLIRSEVRKSLSLRAIGKEAQALVPGLQAKDLVPSYAGNRAQLVSRNGELVDDIVVRSTRRAIHVLNAVSPGLTCSLPFGEHLAAAAGDLLEGGPPRAP